MKDTLPLRRAAVVAGLTADALLVTNPTNVRYLSGFTGEAAYLVVGPKHVVLVTDARYSDQAAEECPTLDVVIRPHTQTLDQAAAAELRKLNASNIGLEGSTTLATAESLADALKAATFVPVHGTVERLRAVKDAGELARIRHAVAVAERAYRGFVAQMRAADSEKDLHDLMDSCLRRAGATASAFPPITAVGERGGRPHAVPDPTVRLEEYSKLLLDWGADCGYKSDLTRTFRNPFGPGRHETERAKYDFDRIHALVCDAHAAAVAAIRPGVEAKAVDAAARRVFDAAGLEPFFTHGLGHGLGLDVHELPRVRKDSTCVLEVGNVITVEPGLYLPGWGGVRVEDDYLVTAAGAERLTTLPQGLEVVL